MLSVESVKSSEKSVLFDSGNSVSPSLVQLDKAVESDIAIITVILLIFIMAYQKEMVIGEHSAITLAEYLILLLPHLHFI